METINSKKYALITGASLGLGKCYALELSKKGINTILISLPNENLKLVSEECRKFGVESFYYEADITDKHSLLEMTKWVNQNFDLDILINNAGCGGTKRFVDCDTVYIERIIKLNVLATSLITNQLLPNLLKRDRAYILNVSSMASFCPIGYKSVYAASKRFIQHFTKGLYQELKHTNVFVSVVHPGQMKTNSDVTRRIEKQGMVGKLGLMSPDKAAKLSIYKLFHKNKSILLGAMNKLNWLLIALIPEWIVNPMLTSVIAKDMKN